MCKGLIGKKIGMSAIFTAEGKYLPVTVVELGPCVVTQIKTEAVDGYNALQLGFGKKKPSRVNKPLQGHMKKAGEQLFAVMKEFAVADPGQYSLGQNIGVELFKVGEKVEITGTTKGRGFAGVIKRHGFSGGRETHGGKCHRIPGSIGCSAWPSRVVKGKKLPGQLGNTRKTIRNIEVVDIRPDENLILIKGPVPGAASGLIAVKKLK
jgi:large subunit ribosomal protein L3